MKDVDQALAVLGDIREKIAASSQFNGFAPEALTLCGAIAALGGVAQTLWPGQLAADPVHYVGLWGLIITAFAAINGVEAFIRTRVRHGEMAHAMIAAVARRVAPFALAILAVAVIICQLAPEVAWIVPGLWLMMFGLVCFTFLEKLPKHVVGVGMWFFACGIAVLIATCLDPVLSPWMMSAPLAVGHGAIAFILL